MRNLPTREVVVKTLFEKWNPVSKTEKVRTEDALGRVLVRDYLSRVSVPVVRASAMDGVAVKGERFEQGMPDTSGWKLEEDFCRADTGDDFDDRFDTVIAIEQVNISKEGVLTILPQARIVKGMNVRPCGSTMKEGSLLARKDRQLRSFDLACLASGGVTEVEVYCRPKVAFLPTGSELVALGMPLERGKNIDSNSILVKNMLIEMGAEPICFPIIKDKKADLEAGLEQALQEADVVILNGGSSKGEEDFNARLLEERGAALFHWVAAAPGKPICVAVIDNKPVINIPGPPQAVLYGMDWCIRAIVSRLLHKPMPQRQTIEGVLTDEIKAPADMEILCMMDVQKTEDGYAVKQKAWKGGTTADALGAGAFYITEFGKSVREKGEKLQVTLLRGLEDF